MTPAPASTTAGTGPCVSSIAPGTQSLYITIIIIIIIIVRRRRRILQYVSYSIYVYYVIYANYN